MLSQAISIRRLRSYEEICRHQALTESNEFSRAELSKLADSFHQAVIELEPAVAGSSDWRASPG